MSEGKKPTNVRANRRREGCRLFGVVVGFLIVGGGAIIGLTYGSRAVVLGVICLLSGAAMLGLLWGVLLLIERWVM